MIRLKKNRGQTATTLLLCLMALLQGVMLIWMQCCCQDFSFKPCSCGTETQPNSEEGTNFSFTDQTACSCTIHLVATPQQPTPVPKSFALESVIHSTALSIASAVSPLTSVELLHDTEPLTDGKPTSRRSLEPAFLCVFRC